MFLCTTVLQRMLSAPLQTQNHARLRLTFYQLHGLAGTCSLFSVDAPQPIPIPISLAQP